MFKNIFKKKTQKSGSKRLADVVNTWHLYQLEWTSSYIKAFIDNLEIFRFDKPVNAGYDQWPFDNEFNIKINTAFGGNWGGAQGINDTVLPQEYVIDYIRVYTVA